MAKFDRYDNGLYTNNIRSSSPSDEYYTPLSLLEEEYIHCLPLLHGKKVLCPCDSSESAYVKFFSSHAEEYGYEFRYSDEDMFTNPDIYWCDIVITNPPFSKAFMLVDVLRSIGKDYALMCSLCGVNSRVLYSKSFKKKTVLFDSPLGPKKLPVVLYSSIEGFFSPNPLVCGSKDWIKLVDMFDKTDKWFCDASEYLITEGDSFVNYKPMVSGGKYVICQSDIGVIPPGVHVSWPGHSGCHLFKCGVESFMRIPVYKD